MVKTYYEQDGNIALLKGKTVGIFGYGSQGHAHALNLRDSGVSVVIGLPETSKSRAKAESAGLRVMSNAEAAKASDVMMILVPDHIQPDLYENELKQYLTAGKTLMFAHGFAIHFGFIQPPANIDVSMIAPKAPGHRVREMFTDGMGVPALVAVHQDISGKAREQAPAQIRIDEREEHRRKAGRQRRLQPEHHTLPDRHALRAHGAHGRELSSWSPRAPSRSTRRSSRSPVSRRA